MNARAEVSTSGQVDDVEDDDGDTVLRGSN